MFCLTRRTASGETGPEPALRPHWRCDGAGASAPGVLAMLVRLTEGLLAHTDGPASLSASGDIKERTTAEHGPVVGSIPEDEVHPRLEPCSAVVTGVLGVHRGSPGRLDRNAPPPQDRCPDQATLFAFPQSDPFERAEHKRAHGSKLRRRLTCVRQTFPAWPDPDRHPNHPASPHQSLVMISLLGAAIG